MDFGKIQQMVDDLFQGKDKVSKQEIVNKAQGSNLGDDAKGALQQLPDGQYTKQDLMSKLQDLAGMKAGAGGGLGGMFGR